MDVTEKFREIMAREGIVTDSQIIPDGELHRFHIEGDSNGSLNGMDGTSYIVIMFLVVHTDVGSVA